MPRRIPDYPDAYAGWNFIASIGSYVSIASLFVFFIVVYYSLTTDSEVLLIRIQILV